MADGGVLKHTLQETRQIGGGLWGPLALRAFACLEFVATQHMIG